MQRFISFLTAGLLLVLLSATELFAQPTTQAFNIVFTNVKTDGFTVVASKGNGTGRIIVVYEGGTVNGTPATTPYVAYTGNAKFGDGDAIGGGYVVYSGSSRVVQVTNLKPGTEYTVKVFEYNGTGYNVSNANNNPRSYFSMPNMPATVSTSDVATSSFDVDWTQPSEGGFDGFQVTVSLLSDFSTALSWYNAAPAAEDDRSMTIENNNPTVIEPNTTYYYRVRTTAGDRQSDWKAGASGVTTKPAQAVLASSTGAICDGDAPYVLTPTGPSPGEGTNDHKFNFYNSSMVKLNTAAVLSYQLTSAGTYYVETVSNKSGFIAVSKTAFTYTINQPGPVAVINNAATSACQATPYTLNLTANAPAPGVGLWTLESGPNTAVIVDNDNPSGQFTLNNWGTYTFRWTITSEGCGSTYAEFTFTLNEPASPAVIQTSAPLGVCGLTTNLLATQPTSGTGTWTKVSGPGTLTFSPNANAANPSVTASVVGQYVIKWTVTKDGCSSNEATIDVTFDATPTTAAAGNDKEVCGTSTNFAGNAPSSGTGAWSKISGPGTPTLSASNPTSTVSVNVAGTYVFRWTITSAFGICSPSTDDVTIEFSQEISDAVADHQTIDCGDLGVTLTNTTPLIGNGAWSITSSPIGSTPSITGNSFTTNTYGTYTVVWTVSDPNGICEDKTDEVSFTLSGLPNTADAGFDQDVCGLTTTLEGNVPGPGTGLWSSTSTIDFTPPGTADFVDDTKYNTDVTVSAYGAYSFEWAITSCDIASKDYVVVTFWKPLDNWTAGDNVTVCEDLLPYTLSGSNPSTYSNQAEGIWIQDSGPGTATFGNEELYNSSVDFSAPGEYVLTWIGTNGPSCFNSANVTINVISAPSVTFTVTGGPYCGTDNTNYPLVSMASPTGGTFSGAGVSGNNFNPSLAGGGTHTLTYTYTAGGCTVNKTSNIVVTTPTVVSWNFNYPEKCQNDGIFGGIRLNYIEDVIDDPSALPKGGTYSGDFLQLESGVYYFNRNGTAPAGVYTITYTPPAGCNSQTTITNTITIKALPSITFAGLPSVCAGDAQTINLNDYVNITGGQFSGTGLTLSGTNNNILQIPSSANTYFVTYTYTANECTNSVTTSIIVKAVPVVTYKVASLDICNNDEIVDLTALVNQSGGTFSGDGVNSANSTFDPSSLSGEHSIYYSITNNGCTGIAELSVFVFQAPVITFNDIGPICVTASAFDFTASPSNGNGGVGTYTGTGVSGKSFDPGVAGIGNHTITYTFTADGTGCESTETAVVTVVASPDAVFTSTFPVLCTMSNATINLNNYVSPPNGATVLFTGTGVSGSTFNQTGLSAGTYTITYKVTVGDCVDETTQNVVINATPEITWTATYGPFCVTSAPVALNASSDIGSGEYTGNGISGNSFVPSLAGAGTHTITYTATNGECSTFETKTIVVDATPEITWTSTYGPFCETSGSVALNASTNVGSGSYSGNGISGNSFVPSLAGAGTHTITYTATNGICSSSVSKTIVVDAVPVITWTATYGPYCATSAPIALNASTNIGSGEYTGNGISGNSFVPSLAGAGTHTITYTATNGECETTATKTIVVNAVPVITWTATYGPFCVTSAPVALNASTNVGSGVYSGNGISGTSFVPSLAGAGTHTITYTATNGECETTETKTIVVDAAPVITWTATYGPYCVSEGAVALDASTNVGSGAYTGNGISGNSFVPSLAGAGTHTITYTATNGQCETTATKTIVVESAPVITWTATYGPFCETSGSVALNASTNVGSGVYSGNGISGTSFVPSLAGAGTHTITYTATNGDCSTFETKTIVVNATPVITWTATYGPYCLNSGSVALNASTNVGSGVYSGNGISGNSFVPSLAGAGTHTITYTATNGQCETTATKTIVVNALPNVTWAGALANVCVTNNPFTLTGGYPSGGTYSGTGVSGNVFDPASANVGTHTFTYTYTNNETGCTNTATNTIIVNAIVYADAGDDDDAVEGEKTYTFGASNPTPGTGTWSMIAGPDGASASYVNANAYNTVVTVSDFGLYTFKWTVTNGNCSTNDLVDITFSESSSGPYKLAIVLPTTPIVSDTNFVITVKTVDVNGNDAAPTTPVDFTLDLNLGNSILSGQLTGQIPVTGSVTRTIKLAAVNNKVGEAGVQLVAIDDDEVLVDGLSALFNVLPFVPGQAQFITFTAKSTNSLTFGWTNHADADGVVVVGKQATSMPNLPSHHLKSGTTYNANSSFGTGEQLGTTRAYVVYKGDGNFVTVTNLLGGKYYAFKVHSYNGTAPLINYNNTNATANPRADQTEKSSINGEELPLVGDNILSSSYMTPNPARDNVSMTIDLIQGANVTISFYTADGKQVLIPVSASNFNAGRHSFNIPLKGLAAGVYSVVITADNEVIIDNLVVMP